MSALDSYIRVPFKPQGRDWGGVDCWGLVVLYYREELGIELDSFQDVRVSNLRDIAKLVQLHRNSWQLADDPRVGDVAIMKVLVRGALETPLSSHLGLVVKVGPSLGILHAEAEKGCHIDLIGYPAVSSRIIEYRRYVNG